MDFQNYSFQNLSKAKLFNKNDKRALSVLDYFVVCFSGKGEIRVIVTRSTSTQRISQEGNQSQTSSNALVLQLTSSLCIYSIMLKLNLGIDPKSPKTPTRKNTCTSMFIVVLCTKIWKQCKCPSVDEWMKKLWYIYTVEYPTTVKKKEFLSTPQMELEDIMLRKEASQCKTNTI